MTHNTDILIVGAGLAGLMAAGAPVAAGRQVTLVDKGRSVGGRLATRRIGSGRGDHGAQFFTARSSTFEQWVQRWVKEELVFVWSEGWSDGSLDSSAADGHPRYAVHGGMNALAKRLAAELEAQGATILTEVQLVELGMKGNGWQAADVEGNLFAAETVVLTTPVPQALALLEVGEVRLPLDQRAELERITYAPCLCGIFAIDGTNLLPDPGALQRPDQDFAWLADNQRKGISPDACVITVHASSQWSRAHYDWPEGEVLNALREELEQWVSPGTHIYDAQFKRWRYALPVQTHPKRLVRADVASPLYFGGDAFGGPRVEGAALSGLAIGEALLAGC